MTTKKKSTRRAPRRSTEVPSGMHRMPNGEMMTAEMEGMMGKRKKKAKGQY